MVRAVVFDAYGTLFDVYSIGVLTEEIFPGLGPAVSNLWRDKQIEYTRLRTLCDKYCSFWDVTRDALKFACLKLGLELTYEAEGKLMSQYSMLDPFPENLGVLKKLRAENVPLSVLSNGDTEMLSSAVNNAGMAEYFDHLLSVDVVQKFKTAPEVYQMAPDALGIPASDILFVSSNAWDIAGATWFGFKSFWVNRAVNPMEELGVSPIAEGRSLEDVVTFLSKPDSASRGALTGT